MKTQKDILSFRQSLIDYSLLNCTHDNGLKLGIQIAQCQCKKEIVLKTRLYMYNIPQRFWDKSSKDVKQSKEKFNDVVVKYCQNINKVLKNGLGIYFSGDNGTGKTLFMSIIAKNIAYKTNYSVYYVTMPQLIQDIYRTNGFDDKSRSQRLDLDNYLLNSDFLFIDELGKENLTPMTRTYIESVLRHRHDNKLPILIASNLSVSDLSIEGTDTGFGATIQSIIDGSCELVYTDPGDHRDKIYNKLASVLYDNSQQQNVAIDEF